MTTPALSSAHHPTARLRAAGAALAALGGVGLAVQGRINGQLGHQLHDGVLAALISFSVGSVLLLAALPILPAARAGVGRLREALRTIALRPWQLLGGTCGAFLVTMQGLTVSILGVAVFTVAVVAGQVVSSLPVDRAGLGPGGPQPITLPRAVGASLAVIAVIVSVYDHGVVTDPGGLWWAVLPAVAGLGLAWQSAVNGQVRVAADNVVVPTIVNFLVGTSALLVAAVVDVLIRGLPESLPTQWWLYTGGTMGIVAIMTAVTAVRVIGVLLLGMSSVAGQLTGAVLLDLFVPAEGTELSVTSLVGIVLTMVAVGIAAIQVRPR
ncbi:DMT family transporter [Actinophytocola algeriensis]|uniref:Transporter family-2 protein n=1 Tax=Actinophytocola algeriensis TaxID=1768010 RepID=A0A7W7VJJ0_9PSEU|nr:DMT family transporter [Actinophytocola algeriensis]MBB4912135.1 transporter family-2 protein [Actinophytocola algeriensis]MBE1477373.1 transporter family-2 protein [Actinophytocola algeriensis]